MTIWLSLPSSSPSTLAALQRLWTSEPEIAPVKLLQRSCFRELTLKNLLYCRNYFSGNIPVELVETSTESFVTGNWSAARVIFKKLNFLNTSLVEDAVRIGNELLSLNMLKTAHEFLFAIRFLFFQAASFLRESYGQNMAIRSISWTISWTISSILCID